MAWRGGHPSGPGRRVREAPRRRSTGAPGKAIVGRSGGAGAVHEQDGGMAGGERLDTQVAEPEESAAFDDMGTVHRPLEAVANAKAQSGGEIRASLRDIFEYIVSMSIDQIAPEALKLPVKERALLAASLWESIEDPFKLAIELSDEEAISLAVERDGELESVEVESLSHADLMKRSPYVIYIFGYWIMRLFVLPL